MPTRSRGVCPELFPVAACKEFSNVYQVQLEMQTALNEAGSHPGEAGGHLVKCRRQMQLGTAVRLERSTLPGTGNSALSLEHHFFLGSNPVPCEVICE